MRISEAFPSEYLKAADLQGQNVTAVISHVEMRDVGEDNKPVVFFQDKKKGLVLNKTNGNNLALAYGDDTDAWAGREVVLYETMVDYQGRSMAAIRVRSPQPKDRKPQQITSQKTTPTDTNSGPRRTSSEMDDREIPF